MKNNCKPRKIDNQLDTIVCKPLKPYCKPVMNCYIVCKSLGLQVYTEKTKMELIDQVTANQALHYKKGK